jgi:hypothetical protein
MVAVLPLVAPTPTIKELSARLRKILSANPLSFRSKTSNRVCGAPGARVTMPPRFTKVTDPDAVKLRFPNS